MTVIASVTEECKAAQARKVEEGGTTLSCGQCERPCTAATPGETWHNIITHI